LRRRTAPAAPARVNVPPGSDVLVVMEAAVTFGEAVARPAVITFEEAFPVPRRPGQGIGRAPRRQRETVVLRYLGDLTEAQTADVLGCSVGSVKTHSSRGLARLREVMPR
jgi:DNA-binding CsgD family transcriptional regulator